MKYIFTFIFLTCSLSVFTQNFDTNKMTERLERQLQSEDDYHHISILLSDRVDVLAMNDDFYRREVSLQQRAFELITALQSKAATSQVSLLSFLQQSDAVDQASVQSYWISNIIFLKAKKELIADLSQRDDVAWLDINAPLAMSSVTEIGAALPEPDNIEPGLDAINAPKLWELGYTGYGKVAFVNDTGVDPIHPAFKMKYRGHYVPPAESWYQFDSGNTNPFDCGDHGTHVLGTMLGLDRNTNDTIGVAFNGLWVGSPILCGIGTQDNVAGFQWSLDPDNNPATNGDMPDVINNSWWDPDLDGDDCESIYVDVLNAMETAGIAVVFSAGNAGPLPMTITTPHNINTGLVNTFTVGALDGEDSNLEIADFSSIGPSHCGGENSILIKPEVSAPGVLVRSAGLNETYNLKSGTSMAAPHVCGAIMLLKEAFPEMTGTELKLALYQSCTDLGDPGEDNTYGMGIIDVFQAYNNIIAGGGVPSNPVVATDVIMYDAFVGEFVCDSNLQPQIKVENGGTEEITSFDIYYEVSGSDIISGTIPWTGSLMTGEKIEIDLPMIENITSGSNLLEVTIQNPNGVEDEHPLNNTYKRNLITAEDVGFTADVEQINGSSSCFGASAIVRAEYENEGTIEWYDEPTDGNLLGIGEVLELENLSVGTTVYADVVANESLGLADPNEADLIYNQAEQSGLTFDSYYPFILKSVKIYAEATGVTIIQLRWGGGEGIVSKLLFVPEIGEQIVDLNFNVPVGPDLQLRINDGISFKHSETAVNYPYSIDAVATIKSSNDENDPLANYYYFYDWEVEYYRHCGRIPVDVGVTVSGTIANADFEMSNDELDLDVDGEVDFTDLSTNAEEWAWDFGDGTTSELQNPSHIYSDTGTFYVSLTVLSSTGCTDGVVDTIHVSGTIVDVDDPFITEEEVNIFPNPTSDNINIDFDLNESKHLGIRVFNLVGQELLSIPAKTYTNEKVVVDISNFENGIYFVAIGNNTFSLVNKVVKMVNKD